MTDNRIQVAAMVQQALQLHQGGKLREAQALYNQVLALDRENPDAIHFLGYLAYQTGNMDAALRLMRHSLALRPDASQYHGNLGIALMHVDKLNEAEAALKRSLELDPRNAESHNNLGSACQSRGRYDEALQCFARAIEVHPDYIDAINNMGSALMEQRRPEEAALQFERALAINPSNADAHFFLGFVRFNQGRLSEGWSGYEWRLDPNLNPRHRVLLRPFPAPKWAGQDLLSNTLLVHVEQGIGDQIWAAGMYAGLMPQVERGARVVIECAQKLVPLFRRSFAWAEVVGRTNPPDAKCLQGVDYQISGGSLGKTLRPDLASFPARADTGGAYLFADTDREKCWRERIAGLGAGLKVGVNWRSNNLAAERGLKCTQLMQWVKLLGTEGVHFVNLQYDECEAELVQAETAFGVRIARYPEVDMFNDLDETAALIRGLDLVIAAPTSVAIMSAALGVATWEMNSGTEWQCFGQPDNPMYPAMRNYVKRWDQPWEQMLDRVAADLAEKVRTHETMRVFG
jgi:tetratricopeptide (TPR) repeat protein